MSKLKICEVNSKSLFANYRDKVLGFFIKFLHDEELAKDLAQDVFLKLIEKEKSLLNVRDLDGYIYNMCRNMAFDHLKKASHDRKYRNFLINAGLKTQNPEVNRKIDVDHYRTVLEDSLNHLPDQQRLIFNLSKREGLSHEKIAEMLDISPNTVRNHLYQALKNIRATTNPNIDVILIVVYFVAGLLLV